MPREKGDSRERSDRAVATRAPDPPAGDEHRTVRGRGASTSVGEAPIAAFSAGRLVGLDGLISLSWALDALPHKVKARKEIAAWPLKVKLGAEYDLIAKKFSGHADCHDSLLGGELSFDVLHSNVEYTKRFDLGDVSSIGIRARCDLSNLGSHSGSRTRMDRWDASFGFTIEPKQSRGPLGANTRVSNTRGSGYDVVTEVPVSKLVAAEVCGHLTLPLPRAEFHAHTGGGGRLTVGEGGLGMHVAQINAVIDL